MEKAPPKERILHAAVHLFARQGFAATGLRELAGQAEVNLAMINYFFGSKKGLLKEILDNFFKEYLAIAKQELTGPESLRIRLSRFIRSSVRYFDAEHNILLVTIAELPHDDPDIVEHKASWARQMAGILDREICQPLLKETGRDIPPTCMGPMLTSLMASRFLFLPVMTQVNAQQARRVDIDRYTEMITELFLKGLINTPTD
ncbi:MAG: TetR/AcrR family transcriptional regulator [Thermodesulfobacteriota bacterium]